MPRWGGYRQGAGRPVGTKGPSTIAAMEIRREIIRVAQKELQPILRALVDSAKGHRIKSASGSIYRKSPDIRAIMYLMDQAVGRPQTAVDIVLDEPPKMNIDFKTATKEQLDKAINEMLGYEKF
jgi:hypothetical protein